MVVKLILYIFGLHNFIKPNKLIQVMMDKNTKLNAAGNKRYNYTSNMLIKSENYIFDHITKGLINSGNLDRDIDNSVSSIQELLEKYQQRATRFGLYD